MNGKKTMSCVKLSLNYILVLKKLQRVIEFNQEAWLKPHIDMNIALRKKPKSDFEKDFLKLMHNSAFGKAMKNVRNHGDIKLVTTDKRRNNLA